MSIDTDLLQRIIEGALMAAAKPMNVQQLAELFDEEERPATDVIRTTLEDIQQDCAGRGFELQQIASGYRFQVVQEVSPWVGKMWEEKPQKYSRALLETLALIAYRQPITRGDIEEIRGVAVSSNIVKTLTERDWIRVVGHKDVPGRPAMYATTKRFLDYFNLKSLDELPTLAEIRDLDSMNEELELAAQMEEAVSEEANKAEAGVDEVEASEEGALEEVAEESQQDTAENVSEVIEEDMAEDLDADVVEVEVSEDEAVELQPETSAEESIEDDSSNDDESESVSIH